MSTSDRALLDLPATVIDYEPLPPIRFGLYLNDVRRRSNLRALERVHRSVAAEIDVARPDVVLADVCRFTGAPFVLRYLKTPAAYYCHEPPRSLHEDAWRPFMTRYQRLRRLWHAPIERLYNRHLAIEDQALVVGSRKVLTNSQYTRARIRSVYGVDSEVCPPGVDSAPLVPRHDKAPVPHVLSVGAFEPHKGFGFLVEALGRVPPGARPALHVISNAQNEDYRSAIEKRARECAVTLSIRVAISELELAREYRAAALFVFAAHDEPLGLAPLEAMAHGLPVLAIAEGGVVETVRDGETGILVSREEDAFARALTDALAAPERLREMAVRARIHVQERWSWPERARVLESHLATLAAEPRAREVRR